VVPGDTPGFQRRERETLIAALSACNGVYLQHLRLRAIRPCAQIAGANFSNAGAVRQHGKTIEELVRMNEMV